MARKTAAGLQYHAGVDLDHYSDRPLPAAYTWAPDYGSLGIGFHDFFCGAGGSSVGLARAGMKLLIGLNHWARAIETHAKNFRDADHRCCDVNNYDLRLLPRGARVLWASPICTEVSPAGGTSGKRTSLQEELELFGPVAKEGYERTRSTFHDVTRAAELWKYDAIIVENVPEVASKWVMFDHWVKGITEVLGYNVQYVSVSSAHVGGENNPHAPQWRDRLYLVFTKLGIPLPDVDPRPFARCFECDMDVNAVQSWKKQGVRRIGKYNAQYVYVCPRNECRHARVEPYVLPAAAAIDWSDLGTPIRTRKPRKQDGLHLAPKTLARIEAGLLQFAQPITATVAGNTFERPGKAGLRTWPVYDSPIPTQTTDSTQAVAIPPTMISVNHDGDDGRAYPAHTGALPSRTVRGGDGIAWAPFTTPAGGTWRDGPAPVDVPMGARTTRDTDALVVPPLLVEHRRNGEARPVYAEPTSTITTGGDAAQGGSHHSLVTPPEGLVVADAIYTRNYGHTDPRFLSRRVTDPLGPITAKDHTALVIPFRRGSRAYPATASALSTIATHEAHGLLARLGIDLLDCHFRMLKPIEHLRAQRFFDDYVVLGNAGEQTKQAGNAVSSNVAQWLGAAVAAVLCGDAVAA